MGDCNPRNFNATQFIDSCFYIRNYSECKLEAGFLNYYEWQYCAFQSRGVPSFLMFCWLLVLLMAIAITADSFFAPCLVAVTKVFRMSQNLAGVTLLALGNGAPDLFSALSAVDSGNPSMAFGSIFGAGILVNTITAGVIMIVCPFMVTRRPVIKDLSFYLIGILWCLFIILRKKVELWSATVLLCLYITYVFVTAISRFLHVKYRKNRVTPLTQDTAVSVNTNKLDNVLNLSRSDIEEVQASKSREIKPAFLTENERTPLLIQRDRRYHSMVTQATSPKKLSPIFRHASDGTLAFKSAGKNIILNKINSTSHRGAAHLARMVMANEYEMKHINPDYEQAEDAVRIRNSPRNANKRSGYLSILEEERTVHQDVDGTTKESLKSDVVVVNDANAPSSSCEIQQINGIAAEESQKLKDPDAIEGYYSEFPGIIKHFLLTIAPIDLENWKEHSVLEKIQNIIQSPIVFILTLTIPVVDDGAFLRGWCKILNSLHCLIAPLAWIVILKVSGLALGAKHFLLNYLVLIIGTFFGATVWITSEENKPPIYHSLFAFLGFITSIVWIYEVANEIVNLLTVVGVVFSIPGTVLGLSVLAFANSIGDLVSNIVLAKKGFPGIGYAACIGGPLFNLLVGIGLPFSIRTAKKGMVKIPIQQETIVLIFTILLVTVMNLVALPALRFRLRSSYGIILIVLYVIFIILVILFALHIIKVHI